MMTKKATKAANTAMITDSGVDPFTFEIIRHKLFRVTDEALITLGKVSGTAVTAEGHDVLVALYRADGTVMLAGIGFLHHILAASQAVKQIQNNYSENPGISQDDVFMANDPYTVAMHTPDIFMISPVHFNGVLTGWVVNYVHVTDIGGIDVGGFCPNAKECYHEGFSTGGLKIVEGGKLRKDIFDTFLNMIRDPGMTGLDLKSQMAANAVAKQRMHQIYQDYGVETVDAVAQDLIQQSEERLRQRLRELPDGTWRSRYYLDMVDASYKLELAANKEGDRLHYDFTGTDPQAPYGINCQFWAAKGGALAPLLPLMAWDLTWNEGVVRCLEITAPEASIVNCKRPMPISQATIGAVMAVNCMSTHVLSKMLGATETYKDRSTGIWMGSWVVEVLGAVNRHGDYVAQMGGEPFSIGEGARSFMDGESSGGCIVNMASKFSNVEFEEQNFPKLILYRNSVIDSGGPGKYRGGTNHERAIIPHGCAGGSFNAVLTPGKGKYFLGGLGVFGGYPSNSTAFTVFRESNGRELPCNLETTTGTPEDARATSIDVHEDDVLYLRADGGGGLGDPLERDPEMVLGDVLDRLVSEAAAKEIYGVIIDNGHSAVDKNATVRQRIALREKRIGKSLAYGENERKNVPRSAYRINEYLQLAETDSGEMIQCTWCGEKICSRDEHWKDHAVVRESSPKSAGSHREDSGEFQLKEYFCFGCATVLDVEVGRKGDIPLYDDIVQWPFQIFHS